MSSIDYTKYLKRINLFSSEYCEEIDEKILRLISEMFIAKIHKRISSKIVFVKLLDIFKIK